MAAARRGRTLAAAVLLVAACSGDPSTDVQEAVQPTEASTVGDHWDIDRTGSGVEVDAGTYVLSVADSGLVRVDRGSAVDEGRAYIVRDGARHDVREVVRIKSGLDHLTLDVVFTDGSTGRLELGALDDDVIAVRVDADDDTGVTDQGITLPPEMISPADRGSAGEGLVVLLLSPFQHELAAASSSDLLGCRADRQATRVGHR